MSFSVEYCRNNGHDTAGYAYVDHVMDLPFQSGGYSYDEPLTGGRLARTFKTIGRLLTVRPTGINITPVGDSLVRVVYRYGNLSVPKWYGFPVPLGKDKGVDINYNDGQLGFVRVRKL